MIHYLSYMINKNNTDMKAKWTHKVVSVQKWNNDNEQFISEHKSLNAAENMVKRCEKQNNDYLKRTGEKLGNEYKIIAL